MKVSNGKKEVLVVITPIMFTTVSIEISIVFVISFSILMYHNQHCLLGLSLVLVDVAVVVIV